MTCVGILIESLVAAPRVSFSVDGFRQFAPSASEHLRVAFLGTQCELIAMPVDAVRNSAAEYHRDDGRANNSGLRKFAESPANYHAVYVEKTAPREPSTREMVIGSLTHSLVFEKENDCEEYVCYPSSLPLRRKVIESWIGQNARGRTVLTSQEWRLAEAMASKLRQTPRANEIIEAEGYTELSVYWDDEETGIPCKARLDKVFLRDGGHLVVDLKTTSQLTNFPYSIVKYGYAMQAAHYCAAVWAWTGKYPRFAFLIVEKAKEHLIGYREVTPQELAVADEYRRFLLREFRQCLDTKIWPESPIVMPAQTNIYPDVPNQIDSLPV